MFSLWIGAYDQGLAYAGLALGTYLTLRVLNFPDLTVDGSFALGGGTAAVLISQGAPVPVALGLAILFGCLAGMVTGLIHTRLGAVASTRIEDALYEVPAVALCIAAGRADEEGAHEFAIAAVQLQPEAAVDLDALSAAVAGLPEYARPRRLRIVDALPMTEGFRPIKQVVRALDVSDGAAVYAWDPRTQRYAPTI